MNHSILQRTKETESRSWILLNKHTWFGFCGNDTSTQTWHPSNRNIKIKGKRLVLWRQPHTNTQTDTLSPFENVINGPIFIAESGSFCCQWAAIFCLCYGWKSWKWIRQSKDSSCADKMYSHTRKHTVTDHATSRTIPCLYQNFKSQLSTTRFYYSHFNCSNRLRVAFISGVDSASEACSPH